ncbi:putative Muscle-specific protein 20 [Hypsibius exemplaris]|uniref:Muscle-specific protein 20 n=1 Tax=Hypsibius exemplaris TaxID=2072580 RepID=A0A9X6RLF1_HYPEX|nr:putative Muscle-specific protein 20 [Hypsibius exemplaris]
MGRHGGNARNPADEQHAIEWIFTILGEPVPQGRFEDILKDGSVLCRFMNKIRPDLLPKFSASEQSAKQRENISLFSKACTNIGIPDTDLFQTIDLYEGKDMGSVANCLARLGGVLQQQRPDLPVHGPKLSEAQARQFTAAQEAAGKMHY